MGEYIVPLKDFHANIIHADDGSVWCWYLISGAVFDPYSPDTIGRAQVSQQRLFQALAGGPSNDILLLGIKAETTAEEIIRRCTAGLPDFSKERYANYFDQLQDLYRDYKSGVRREYTREYVLAAKLRDEQGSVSKVLGREPDEVDKMSIAELEETFFNLVPTEYAPVRCAPAHLRWVAERFRKRGISVPAKPGPQHTSASFGPRSFPETDFDETAQALAYADDFAERYEKGERKKAKEWFLARWSTVEQSTMAAVLSTDERTPDLPNGPTSYQVMMAVRSYPYEESDRLNSFTYLVDQEIGVDADFAQRISFDWTAVTKEGARTARNRLRSEAAASSSDELDYEEYEDIGDEMQQWRSQVRAENAQVAIQVTTIFAFAHPNWRYLSEQVENIRTHYANNDFDVRTFPGGQHELYKLMAPGCPLTPLGADLQQISTIPKFAASLPVRTIHIGSPTGFPVAINKENALGQIVHMDLMRSTEAGSGSIGSVGEPRAGKSYLNKKVGLGYVDLGAYVHAIDMSTHGEYAVAARALPPHLSLVVHIARATYSMDPLRVYADDPETAKDIFLDLWLPLLDISIGSEAGSILIGLLESRAGGIIHSTRDLYQYLASRVPNMTERNPERPWMTLYTRLRAYASVTYTALLIDPIDASTGEPAPLPVLPSELSARLIVFRTNDMTPPKAGAHAGPREKFALAAYFAIAKYTQQRFSRINDVCVTLADEVAFLGDSRVPEILIKTPDKMGAKEKNLVIASTQLPDALDENYDLIPYRFAFRQREQRNAADSLTWANIPATPGILQTMTTDMAPLSRDQKTVEPGREGECFMNVNGIAFVKILPMPADRARLSDTTASRMIREGDLDPITVQA